ncbi:MAG: hypothetical protein COY40_04265 [Alphaproteobacteria bacterium CG_4_10_14_0_8_um_filter_53_9]|nr:MAG: hypothetical protein COY40_04265 [Alphaproteobacteria bacterium CG_4_10_14_0_8_um_filter_53_9]
MKVRLRCDPIMAPPIMRLMCGTLRATRCRRFAVRWNDDRGLLLFKERGRILGMKQIVDFALGRGFWLLLAVLAVGLLMAAQVLEHGFGVLPCKMCLWQRWTHFGILFFAMMGFWAMRWRLFGFEKLAIVGVSGMVGYGLGIALWQFAAQQAWLPFPSGCTGDASMVLAQAGDLMASLAEVRIVPCDKETFTLLGLSLAGWNVLVMLGVLGGLSFKK